MGLITEVRGCCCSVSSGMGLQAQVEGSGRAEVGGEDGLRGSAYPRSLRGPQPEPFPLLAAELNQGRQHTDLRLLEALQKHEVSPGERGSLAGVQPTTETPFVRLWVPADSPAKLFRGAGRALAPQPWGLDEGEGRLGPLGALFCNSVDFVHTVSPAKLREAWGWRSCPLGA